MENFSEHLKSIRISKKLTQEQVARKVDIALRVYQRYERGEGKPSFENLWALADFFGISVDELMGRRI
jgi:transcriptional regulator with XRE-family HTH domain